MHSCSPPLGGPRTFPLDLRVQVPPLEMEASGIGQSSEDCVFISQLSGFSALGLKGVSGSLTTTPEPVLVPLNSDPAAQLVSSLNPFPTLTQEVKILFQCRGSCRP